jgi:hypothetical protein
MLLAVSSKSGALHGAHGTATTLTEILEVYHRGVSVPPWVKGAAAWVWRFLDIGGRLAFFWVIGGAFIVTALIGWLQSAALRMPLAFQVLFLVGVFVFAYPTLGRLVVPFLNRQLPQLPERPKSKTVKVQNYIEEAGVLWLAGKSGPQGPYCPNDKTELVFSDQYGQVRELMHGDMVGERTTGGFESSRLLCEHCHTDYFLDSNPDSFRGAVSISDISSRVRRQIDAARRREGGAGA